MANDVNQVMQSIPENWRTRWCNAEFCACMGCVQIGNRLIMAKELTGKDYEGDPEYIDEARIPQEIYDKFKVKKKEWETWMSTNNQPLS